MRITSWGEREAALDAIKRYDEEHGYRAPSDWDHVHRVERDEAPVGCPVHGQEPG